MGRNFGNYDGIKCEHWDARAPQQPSHPTFNLRKMIEAYDAEGAQTLNAVLDALATKWPKLADHAGDTSTHSAVNGQLPGVHIVITLRDDTPTIDG